LYYDYLIMNYALRIMNLASAFRIKHIVNKLIEATVEHLEHESDC
jgi:hypothetical protein